MAFFGSLMMQLIIGAYLCFSGIYEAKAADMKVEQQLIGNFAINFILINREIRSGDFDKFVNTLQQLPRNKTTVIVPSGPGGNLTEALNIGLVIRQNKLKTMVIDNCFSACAFIALSGYRKGLAGAGAVLGFHGASFSNGELSAEGNAYIGSYLAKLGYHDNFIGAILRREQDFTIISQDNAYVIANYFKVHFCAIGSARQLISFMAMN